MADPQFLHPANAEELANFAERIGDKVLCDPLLYLSENGSGA